MGTPLATYCPTCRGIMRPAKGTLQCIRCAHAGRARTVLRGGKAIHLSQGQMGLETGAVPKREEGFDPTLQPRRSDWDAHVGGTPHPRLGLFPFDGIRDGQMRLTRDVTMALRGGRHLVAEAPTGIGKTAAALAPALQHAIDHKRTVLFLTSRQSQHKIAVDTLRAVAEKRGAKPRVVDLVSKRDMCLRPEADAMHPGRFPDFCSRETRSRSCKYLGDVDDDTLRQVHDGVLHVEELMQVSKEANLCPHMVAMEAAPEAHVVVADYNHLFSDIRERSLERLGVELKDVIVIVDEAHNLPERIKQSHGHKLTPWLLTQVEGEARGQRARGLEADVDALRKTLKVLSDRAEQDGSARDAPLGGESARIGRLEIEDLWETFARIRNGLGVGTHRTIQDTLDDLTPLVRTIKKGTDAQVHAEALALTLEDWGRFRDGALRYLRWDAEGVELHVRLLDPGVAAREVFHRVHSAILMSGTIVPEMARDLLGLDAERTALRTYASPFPPENRLTLIARGISTRYAARSDAMWERIAGNIIPVLQGAKGNVAVFCPSYHILREVRASAAALGFEGEEIVEDPSWGKSERDQVLDRLEGARKQQGAVLWGVLGGSFSEGVDFKDNLLSGVVVVGLPLAPPDLELEATQAYLDKRFPGRGRLYAATYPAMDKVRQAMGRGIRSGTDRCVTLLMDERYQGPPYRQMLPVNAIVTPDPVPAAVSFLKGHGL